VGYALLPEESSLFYSLALHQRNFCRFADIRDRDSLEGEFQAHKPSVVIHLAAQSLVLKSYGEPRETFDINVVGTMNVLEAAMKVDSVKVVLVITTDKVYRNDGLGRRFVESDPLLGRDPYSASKVATESVCAAWSHINALECGVRVLVARAGNVIGGGDMSSDRLIPDLVRSLQKKEKLQIRNLNATRPWQHVLDPLGGYIKYIEEELKGNNPPSALNFGPIEKSKDVAHVLRLAENYFGQEMSIEVNSPDKIHKEAAFLDLDSSLAHSSLAWTPKWDQDIAINKTFEWWKRSLSEHGSILDCCMVDIEDYLTI
jgi:CDP-glucose 4,6-dehydratase